MIKVILWDIDGTLLNFLMAEKYSIRKCFQMFGLGECTDEMISRYSAINLGYWKRLERQEVTREQVLNGRFREFFKNEGIDFADVEEFNRQYQFGLGDKVFFNDNGYEQVKKLRGRYRQYVVTNGTFGAQERKLAKSGLGELMEDTFISEKIGADKPSCEFFDAVWAKIGPYEKDEVVIIGDSLSSDMLGGNNAGIKCIWYNPEGAKNHLGCRIDCEIQNLNQVEDALERL